MFTLPALPFAEAALSPHMSERTLQFHHGKHHKAYVDKLNDLVRGTPLENLPLEEVVRRTKDSEFPGGRQIFNNAGQHWNHSFFWQSLSPQPTRPEGDLSRLLDNTYGGHDGFAQEFKEKAAAHFGSGWAWLVAKGDKLEIVTTHDADTPISTGEVPLLCCDLWEHAYYLDYQNRRPDFIAAFTSHLANWPFASKNLERARQASQVEGATHE